MDLEAWIKNSLQVVADPSRRLYWLFLLSTAFIILGYWLWNQKRITWRRIQKTFFSPRYWFHKSTAVDASCLFLNTAIRTSLLLPLLGSHLLGAMWIAKLLQTELGTAPQFDYPWWLIAVLYTGLFFVVEDFSRFYLHRLMHITPWLWRFHRLHHSAEILTPLTLHRVHPVEMTLYFLRGLIVFSLVSGFFIYFSGKKLTAFEILGVDALGFLFNMAAANLRHSHIFLGFGRWERWLISPAQHQIHHSKAIEHRDKNFGTCLSCWDRWFSSYVHSSTVKRLKFGLS